MTRARRDLPLFLVPGIFVLGLSLLASVTGLTLNPGGLILHERRRKMKRLDTSLVVVATFASLLIGGRSQAAPASAERAKAVELAQAAAPATKANFPIPGKAVNVIVPYAAGGGTSVAAQLLASQMAKFLNTPVQVVHRPGGATQVGLTELVRSKPDGYTIGYAGLANTPISYLDPERQAVYNRKSFRQVATHSPSSTSTGTLPRPTRSWVGTWI